MYKFVCENGHEHTLSVAGCRVCPTEKCGKKGTSTKIIPTNSSAEKITQLGESYIKNAKGFLFWAFGLHLR